MPTPPSPGSEHVLTMPSNGASAAASTSGSSPSVSRPASRADNPHLHFATPTTTTTTHSNTDGQNSQHHEAPRSRRSSWLVRTNSEYANMFVDFAGDHSSHHEKSRSNSRSTSRAPSISGSLRDEKTTAGMVPTTITPSGIQTPRNWIEEDVVVNHEGPIQMEEYVPAKGTVSPLKASLLLAKGFVGTGILFLPNAMANGGILFSILALIFVAVICCIAFLMLVQVRLQIHESFQDMGRVIFGKWCRLAILFSVALSQIGFCIAYLNFVAQNLNAVVQTFTKCTFHGIEEKYYIFIVLAVLMPLVLIRRMEILSFPSMIANVFIIYGVLVLWYYSIDSLVENGPGPNIVLFNQESFALFIGTAIFSFEGIGLVIPITESMAEPEKFPKVLALTLTGVTFLFASVGALCYSAYGSTVQTIVLMNLPVTSGWTISVELLYSLAIILSVPLMLSPASKILEHGLFGDKSGGGSNKVKWMKNLTRVCLITACAVVSFAVGPESLDKFVSFVGSVFCTPLCVIYPAAFHYKVCAKTKMQKFWDAMLFFLGVAMMVYTLYITINSWVHPAAAGTPLDQCAAFA